jgi:hypothetical protein
MTETEILKRTRECGECLEWTGAYVHNVAPVISIGNRKIYTKRRLLELAGKNIEGLCVTNKCGNTSCVNPKHLQIATKAHIIQRTAATGVFSSTAVRARVAAGKRKTSKLSQEAAFEIRNSNEPVPVLAAKHGISDAYGYMIRRGQFRKDYSNPFAGLMT